MEMTKAKAVSPSGGTSVQRFSTPLLVATFVICGGTGVVLWWDSHLHALKELHYWASVAMAGAVGLHLWKHARSLALQVRRWPLWAALGVVTLGVVAFVLLAPESPRGRGHGHGDGSGQGWRSR